jgi:hypothetical protein
VIEIALNLLIPMQKVVGSLSLQIATFSPTPHDFSAAVCRRTANGLPNRRVRTVSENERTLRFAGLFESG